MILNNKIIIVLLFVLMIPSVLAIEASNISIQPGIMPLDIQNVVLQDGLKTRNEIKAYLDRRIESFKTEFTKESENFIQQKFAILDTQIKNEAAKILIKAEIYLIAGIFFSIMLIYFIHLLIKRLINRKATTERKVILEWLEAHEEETKTMKEFNKETREVLDWLLKIKKKSQESA